MTPDQHRPKVDAWTGMRGVAAFWVILYHLKHCPMQQQFGWITPFVDGGIFSVDLFFLLSGMVISYVHQSDFKSWNTRVSIDFWVSRLSRMYPLHLLMLFMVAGFQCINFYCSQWLYCRAPARSPDGFRDFTLSLLNIHAWETTKQLSFNFPSWSVSAEWFAYLFFPLISPTLCRLRLRWQNLAIIALCLGAFYWVTIRWGGNQIDHTYHLGLIRVSTEFIAGCCLYNLMKMSSPLSAAANYIVPANIFLILMLIVNKAHYIWAIAAIASFLYYLPQTTGWTKAIFSNRIMIYFGERSYAIYMVHVFVMYIVENVLLVYFTDLNRSLGWIGIPTLLVLLLTTVLAEYIHRFVEVPARYAIRNWWRARAQTWAPLRNREVSEEVFH